MMRFIRKIPTAKLVGWHPSHLMRKVRAGEFPQPVRLGTNSVAFVADEVLAWQEAKIAERDAKATEAAT